MSQKQYKPHFEHLKNKWTEKRNYLHKTLWEKHRDALHWLNTSSKHMLLSSAAGIVMLAPPSNAILAQNFPTPPPEQAAEQVVRTKGQLVLDLKKLLPDTVQPLTEEQEHTVGSLLSDYFHLPVSAELQGKRLNRSYGIIGAEQHLMRYPGDTIDTHFDTEEEAKFISSGMAPGRGAWGYFTDSRESMTEQDKQREKYYIAVQTFLSPGWKNDVKGHYSFFKYRKMLVVNPENGKAMVAVIGDAGPAEWTGKHLGGSPEVMGHLERQDGGAKGPVLYFFINDPEDKIPLGPITIPQ